MTESFPKQLVIPTSWLAAFLTGGVLHTGMMYQQFQQMREDQKSNAALVALIRENQINGLAAIATIKSELARQDERIVVIERLIISRGQK